MGLEPLELWPSSQGSGQHKTFGIELGNKGIILQFLKEVKDIPDRRIFLKEVKDAAAHCVFNISLSNIQIS